MNFLELFRKLFCGDKKYDDLLHKLHICNDALDKYKQENDDLVNEVGDYADVVEPAGEAGNDYGQLQMRIEIDF